MPRVYTPLERLLRFVDRNHVGTGCWEWTGSTNGVGYGQLGKGEVMGTRYAHRIAWMLFVGAIPEGADLDHLCRNRGCVNPAHLEPVTRAENLRRGDTNGAKKRLTHCPKGHPYDGENLYLPPARGRHVHGGRECRACRVARDKARHARQRRVA